MAAQRKAVRPLTIWSGSIIVSLAIAAVIAYRLWPQGVGEGADANAQQLVALGQEVYTEACASCHGEALEGQPNWRIRLENGRLPAPPHDETGHTWHHPDEMLFGITKIGPQAFAGLDDYETDMPAFEDMLSDQEIWAVLAYIKSTWPLKVRARQEDINLRSQQD
jgi:mono/diheme cytochrome c family protein